MNKLGCKVSTKEAKTYLIITPKQLLRKVCTKDRATYSPLFSMGQLGMVFYTTHILLFNNTAIIFTTTINKTKCLMSTNVKIIQLLKGLGLSCKVQLPIEK